MTKVPSEEELDRMTEIVLERIEEQFPIPPNRREAFESQLFSDIYSCLADFYLVEESYSKTSESECGG